MTRPPMSEQPTPYIKAQDGEHGRRITTVAIYNSCETCINEYIMAKAEKSTTGANYSTSEYWAIDKLRLWDRNPRSIKGDRFEELKTRLKRQGQIKPLLVAKEDSVVIGGNMRLRAMKDLGWTDVWVSVVSAPDDRTKFDLALTDNEEFGYYEKEQLAELALDLGIPALELEAYEVTLGDPVTLKGVLDDLSPEPEVIEDEAPDVDELEPPVSKLGEIYQLGRHRVMCGSATAKDDVAILVNTTIDAIITDPPYGMNAVSKSGVLSKTYGTDILGDDDIDAAKDSFVLAQELYAESKQFWWGANYYSEILPSSECWVVWNKNNGGSDQTDAELAWSNCRSVVRMFTQASEKVNRVHPTQKPVDLTAWIIKKFDVGNNVLDLFLGSGSTLIACEQTDRTCYGMELDPKYVDVIRKRYHKFVTGSEEGWEEATPAVEVTDAVAA